MSAAYRLFGLMVKSAVPLPLSPVHFPDQASAFDLCIEYGRVPGQLANPDSTGEWYQTTPTEVLLQIRGTARYLIQGGRRIIVMPEAGAAHDAILLYLMGSAMGALLHQRNILVLHAGAITVKNSGMIFLGPSGVGKSTLTAGLQQRGYSFLADDVCAIARVDAVPSIIPGFPLLKLWDDILDRMKTDSKGLRCFRGEDNYKKYFLPVDCVSDVVVPLRAGYTIETSEDEDISITELKGADRIESLITNTYRMEFLQGQGGQVLHFQQCAEVASRIPIYRIIRPRSRFLLEELMNLLEVNFLREEVE